jgi:hypothetical protein
MARECLTSFLANSRQPLELVIHDDGSLTAEDFAVLKELPGGVEIISKQQANETMAEIVRPYPNLRKYRDTDFWGIKLLDCVHFGGKEVFCYCDTDILFYRPFQGLFDLDSHGADFLFMLDAWCAYSVNVKDRSIFRDRKCVHNANGGLLCMRRSLYDLAFLDDLFGDRRLHGWTDHREQTAWGFLAARGKARTYDKSQFPMVQKKTRYSPRWVGAHFFSPGRFRMTDLKAHAAAGLESVSVSTRPATMLTPTGYLAFKAWSVLKRRYL